MKDTVVEMINYVVVLKNLVRVTNEVEMYDKVGGKWQLTSLI